MITTKYVRDHVADIRESLKKRKSNYPLDELLQLDTKWRAAKTSLQELQAKRNKDSQAVADAKKGGKDAKALIASLGTLKQQITELEGEVSASDSRIEQLLWNMPNVLHKDVPYGKDDVANVEIRKWGKIKEKKFDFNHEDALMKLGLIDIERAAKISGARFYFLKGDLMMLEQALIRFALDEMTKKGFTALMPPFMIRKKYYKGVTALGDFEELLYKVADPKEVEGRKDYDTINDELFMVSTSEHAMAAMHAEETIAASELPLKYAALSPCFRREAGAHGKDSKGIYRVHQFQKVEQFIFCKEEDSWKYHEELLKNSEELFQKLGLPYRVIEICTGDIGTVAARKYDIEAYMPGRKAYGEVVSCSNCTDWQSLRLDMKYEEKGEKKYLHTLNSTAVATTRALVAIVENYINEDGSITVPEALVAYMGKKKITK